jgi:hypothetical protein
MKTTPLVSVLADCGVACGGSKEPAGAGDKVKEEIKDEK